MLLCRGLSRRLRTRGVILAVTISLVILYVQHYKFSRSVDSRVINVKVRDSSGRGLVVVAENMTSDSEQKCVLPSLDVADPAMKAFFVKQEPVVCPSDPPDWVSVHNGTLRFSPEVRKKVGDFKCDFYPLRRDKGDKTVNWGQETKNIQNGSQILSDFFKVNCYSSSTPPQTYSDVHLGVASNAEVDKRLASTKPAANGLDGMSVLMLGFDSMSRMSWMRRMPKTREFFVNTLKAIEMKGYNIMGDGTPAALFPILTGKHEEELHESRRNHKNAKPVDDYPWIWKEFSSSGYLTSWADSEVTIAPFNYRLLGFDQAPTDYFMRPYYLGVEKMKKKYAQFCRGPVPKHKIWFNWVRDLYYKYGNKPKFMIHFYATLSHDDNNRIMKADQDLRDLLTDLHSRGYLEHTLVVLMGDHGARYSAVRDTWSGKLEERMPYMALRLPDAFSRKYPHIMKNLNLNSQRLTSPMDIHETFRDVLRFDGAGLGSVKNRGISLFKEIPIERTCADADIRNHWCACLSWTEVSLEDGEMLRAAQASVNAINNFTAEYRSDCAELQVDKVVMANMMTSNTDMLKFVKSMDIDGRKPGFQNMKQNYNILYQLTFHTKPGNGHFEVTIAHILSDDSFSLSANDISRINKYGNDPACILEKNRQIRQYCYCKKISTGP